MRQHDPIALHWLNSAPVVPAGITWGVPWAKGELLRDEPLSVLAPEGDSVPAQSWPTAFWPDGSVKWTAHAVSLGSGTNPAAAGTYALVKGEQAAPLAPLTVEETSDTIVVDTGAIVCRLNRSGASVIRDITRGDKLVCSDGKLVGIREERSTASGLQTTKEEPFQSAIWDVTVEQSGPVRAVVKLSGRHKLAASPREWLPFTVRFYFYAGQYGIRAVHTFLYDGNPHKDFLKGIGIAFKLPMQGPLYNRHVRLAGDKGFFRESPKGLMNWRLPAKYEEMYKQQLEGEAITLTEEKDADFLRVLDDSAVWDSYKLVQIAADSYTITKRTKTACSWIKAVSGNRAAGLAYAGSEGGGLAVGVRHFWQKHPSSLEAAGMGGNEATLTAWFWSPDSAAMDLRQYDTETHVMSAYEGAEEMRSTPYGVGNTTELNVWCFNETPDVQLLADLAAEKEAPSLLICEPVHYYRTKTLGTWSVPDRSSALKATLEDGLDEVFRFYKDEVEQRGWYGFWDYGDVMHSYDAYRHTWKYDIGGCAWQNAELVPNMWLWYMFLRSGREDVFRFAEAMTRHTSEVDVYHIGEYAGLGSRHNVLHWGCGCKEARIGMAGLHRFYYYLTADERIGDIMDEVKDADYAIERLDPMRYYFPKDQFVTHARSGPDWSGFCSNWMTRWERFEDTSYRDKMLLGIECLKQMPHRLLNGPVFGYDPKTGVLQFMSHENYGRHLTICMGGAQVWIELADLLGDDVWADMLAEYGEFYNLPKEEKQRRTNGDIPGKDWNIPMLSTTMMAYSAVRRGDAELARLAWKFLLEDRTHWQIQVPLAATPVPELEFVRPIREIDWMTTNTAAQWCMNLIVCLELIGDQLPERH